MTPASAPVAIIGGGYAGMAAAVTLADTGCPVVVFETAKVLGGRARRVTAHAHVLDNGQHLLLGAYTQTLALLRLLHGGAIDRVLLQTPLHLEQPGRFRLSAPRLPAPLHLVMALAAARGLTARERLATLRFVRRLQRTDFVIDDRRTVAELLLGQPRAAVALLWEPLCIAALNTPPAAASARIFGNVLRATFAAPASRSDLLLPCVDLTALLPDPAAGWISARGGEVRRECRVHAIVTHQAGVSVTHAAGEERFRAAIVAVAPHQLAALFGPGAPRGKLADVIARVARFAYEPICTVYLRYPRALGLPRALLKLDDAPGQWIADRQQLGGAEGLAAVVISTDLPGPRRGHDELVRAVDAQLHRFWPTLPAPQWSQVITEQRATYACVAGLARPAAGELDGHIHLAGDYTDAEFPATLEAAVSSGVGAARSVLAASAK